MKAIQALDVAREVLDAEIRKVRFSKVYAMAKPEAVARLDRLHQAREALEKLQGNLAALANAGMDELGELDAEGEVST